MQVWIQEILSWGGGSRLDGQKQPERFFFSPQLILQFTEGVKWFYYRGNYTFSKDQEGVLSIDTHITCDPLRLPPPMDPHMTWVNNMSQLGNPLKK